MTSPSPLRGTERVLHAFLGVLGAIVVDRDYIQRYRYGNPLAAGPSLRPDHRSRGPMEAVELPLARKSQTSPGVRGTLSPFGVPRSSHPVISNAKHASYLPSSWYTLAVLALSPAPGAGSVVTRLPGGPMYLPGWGLTRVELQRKGQ